MENALTPMAVAALVLASPALAETDQTATGGPKFEWGERNTSCPPAFDAQFRAPIVVTQGELDVETIVDGLVHPWAIRNLPGDSDYLVTERTGALRHVTSEGD